MPDFAPSASRSSANLDPRRRRILFRARHRGTREMDILMGGFVDHVIGDLAEPELDVLEALLEVPDRDVFAWLTGEQPVPENYDTDLFGQLKAFHSHSGPVHA